MASYTQNYQLHQWEGSDAFLRTDFNEDFKKIDSALNSLADKVVQTVSGNYVGTGECGKEHPNQLEFPFEPDLVVIVVNDAYTLEAGTLVLRGQTVSSGIGSTTNTGSCLGISLVWSGRTLTWYAGDAGSQLNDLASTYRYFALA